MGCMSGLFPLPALHSHTSLSPKIYAVFQGGWIAQGVVLAKEEESWRSDWAVVENTDAAVVEICCVAFEEPEVEHCSVFDEVLKAGHQSLAKS